MEALSKVNQELESQAAYVEGRAFSERRKSETEIKQADREHRLEQAKEFQKQAELIRQSMPQQAASSPDRWLSRLPAHARSGKSHPTIDDLAPDDR